MPWRRLSRAISEVRVAMLPGADSIFQGKENYVWCFKFCFEVGWKYGLFRSVKGLGMRASQDMIMRFREFFTTGAEGQIGFPPVVENWVCGPLAVEKFKDCKFAAMWEMFGDMGGGCPINGRGGFVRPAVLCFEVAEISRLIVSNSRGWLHVGGYWATCNEHGGVIWRGKIVVRSDGAESFVSKMGKGICLNIECSWKG
jgi:hypothetical protein